MAILFLIICTSPSPPSSNQYQRERIKLFPEKFWEMQKGNQQKTCRTFPCLLNIHSSELIKNKKITKYILNLSSDNNNSKPTFTQILVASSLGLVIAAAMHYRIRRLRDQKIIPRRRVTDSGRVEKLERFPHYVGNYYIWSENF